MRIAITVDPYLPVPPRHYGGIERVVDFLVRGLAGRGHQVTLLAHPGSRGPAKLIPYGSPPHSRWDCRARELWQVGSHLSRMQKELDVVHSFGRLAALLPVLPIRSLPKIQSYQRDALPAKGIRRALRLAGSSLRFTACSTHMYARSGVPGRWKTVFNGVDLGKYTFAARVPPDAPLVFLGRLERFKGAHHGVAIAKASGRRLVIAGNLVKSGPDASYFDDQIAPSIDGDRIRYVGPVDDEQKNALLRGASALLMPVEWEEPFGIVMAEAMACGTPVVGFARGSLPEVVRDVINGFLCRDATEAASAVARLQTLDRARVRADASSRFSSDVIVEEYERIYEDLLHEARGSAESLLENAGNVNRS